VARAPRARNPETGTERFISSFKVAEKGSLFEYKVIDRKYAQAVLTQLRSRETSQVEFRKGLVRLGRVLGLEIVEDFEVEERLVETPLGATCRGTRIKDFENVCIVTVLRAAWPLTEGLVKIFYLARQGVIAARRVEEKGMHGTEFEIEVNYIKVPRFTSSDILIVSDVMVATGSTLIAVLKELLRRGRAKRYYIASVISTPVAIEKLRKLSTDVNIHLKLFTVAVDPELDSKGYIVPGLGDAGDRAFGT
jgi:uracil phosphoribosyltransferase